MLRTSTEFPNPGSFATVADHPQLPLRIIQHNADGTLLVSGIRDGKPLTRECWLSELTECNPLTLAFQRRMAA